MNLITLFDSISCIAILTSVIVVFAKSNNTWFSSSLMWLLLTMAFFHFSNLLEWTFLINHIDPFGSVLLPMVWILFLFSNLSKLEIGDLKSVQDSLTMTNDRFRIITEAIHDIFWLETANMDQQLFISSSHEKVFGAPPEKKLLQQPHYWLNFTNTLDSPTIINTIKRSIAAGNRYELEYAIKKSDFTTGWVLERGYPVRGRNGQTVTIAGVCTDITELKNAQLALQNGEERLRIILKSIGDGVIITAMDGKIEWMNSAAEKITGWYAREANGKYVSEVYRIYDVQSRTRLTDPTEHVLKNSKQFNIQKYVMLISLDGTEYFVSDSAAPIRDKYQTIHGAVLTFTDVTSIHNLQQEISDSKERLELAIKSTDLGTWDWNIRTGQLHINDRWASMIGYTVQEIAPHFTSWESLVHPEDLENVRMQLNSHLEGTTPFYESEYRLRSKDGDWIWVFDKGKIIQRDIHNRPVRICGTHLDITSRIQHQKTLQALLDKTTEQKEFIKKIFDTNPNILYIFDLDEKRNIYQNKNIINFIGYTDQQIMDMGSNLLPNIMHPDDLPEMYMHLQVLRSAPQNKIFSIEYRIKGADETWHWFLSYDTPFSRGNDGLVRQIIGSATDISELKGAHQKLKIQQMELQNVNDKLSITNTNLDNANKRLTELDILKNDFISIASHELRTPVTAVLGFAQTLLNPDFPIDESSRKRYLGIIEKESFRLGKLIDNLLDIKTIEAGKSELEMKPESLKNIALDAIRDIQPLSEQKIKLIVDEHESRMVLCSKERIKQVFLNILDNAMRYGPEITVTITSEASDALVAVHDNGPGIPAHHLKMIFEKFYRIRGETKPGTGSGLGLAIVKDIITSHGGKTWAESEKDNGTTIYFTLKYINRE